MANIALNKQGYSCAMTALGDNLKNDVQKIFNTTWDTRKGQVVPKTDDVALSNGAVKLDVAVLYADLAHFDAARQEEQIRGREGRPRLSVHDDPARQG